MKLRLARSTAILSALALALLGLCASIDMRALAPLEWLPAKKAQQFKPLPSEEAPSLPDLARLEAAWDTPAFSPDRKPDPPLLSSEDSAMSSYALTGLVEGAGTQAALIRDSEGKSIQLHVGDTLPNGWRLSELSNNKARFSSEDRAVELSVDRPRLPEPSPDHAHLPDDAVQIESPAR